MIFTYVFVHFVFLLHDIVYHSNRNIKSASIGTLRPFKFVKQRFLTEGKQNFTPRLRFCTTLLWNVLCSKMNEM